MIETVPLYLSLIMAIYLFIISYIEGIKISNVMERFLEVPLFLVLRWHLFFPALLIF